MRRRTLLESNLMIDPITGRGIIDNYEVVDLNLPSGTLWATCNVGASKQYNYGNYYAYGRTTSWAKTDTAISYAPLKRELDAATVNMGGHWMMPSKTLLDELIANTNYSFVKIGGLYGGKFVSKTNSARYVFLPAAGYYYTVDGSRLRVGNDVAGLYRTDTFYSLHNSGKVYYLKFNADGVSVDYATGVYYLGGTIETSCGFPMRAVYSPADWNEVIDLHLPSGTLWSKYNIAKSSNGDYSLCTSPELFGCYFSWGNIEGYNSSESYNWSADNYSSTSGASVSTDITPISGHDASRVLLGNHWQTPTATMFQELFNNCSVSFTTGMSLFGNVPGLYIREGTSSISYDYYRSFFIPAAGTGSGSSITQNRTRCHYWSATRASDSNAYGMRSYDGSLSAKVSLARYQGKSIRPVFVP